MTFVKSHRWKLLFVAALLILWLVSLPRQLFKEPLSVVLLDKDETLLGARIATDGQWRFPLIDTVPQKFVDCITTFEDKRFFNHFGVDPIGFGRAMWQNIKSGEIVSGGSTLTMQVIRLSRKGKSRTLLEKLIEIWLATRLELTHSKEEILKRYATYAPFGGNVVGLETASWRYFGRAPELLNWSEQATLAVLPNAPSLIHVGRNRDALFQKRNRLLDRLSANGKLDSLTCALAKEVPLPEKPFPLPQMAPHLLDRMALNSSQNRQAKFHTTINAHLQNQITNLASHHHNQLKFNEIHNLAAIVIEVETGEVLAYLGNAPNAGAAHGQAVDILRSPRSTGSILKPFLYAQMLDEGELLPEQLVNDIPISFSGYSPENYRYTYDGIVPAKRALSRSLNIPFVNLLQQFRTEKFHTRLRKMGLTTINRSPDHYGLSLILGGAEARLDEVTASYASMARTLGAFFEFDGEYREVEDFTSFYTHRPLKGEPLAAFEKVSFPNDGDSVASIGGGGGLTSTPPILSAAAIYHTFEAMSQVERPNASGEWEQFGTGQKIAWKTGTSFGFRDAWAVGVTQRFAVGVWVGNADGEGRPGLVGVQAAAPILFDIFSFLPAADWFEKPYDEMVEMETCKNSGMRALEICPKDTSFIIAQGQKAATCRYHQLIHLDAKGQFQVTDRCELPSNMQHRPWFVLPPVQEHFYKKQHPEYQPLPPFAERCKKEETSAFQLIYPLPNSKIYLPVNFDESLSPTVFKAAHRNEKATIYWHLNQTFLGETKDFHHLKLKPLPGKHTITLVDNQGNRLTKTFEILARKMDRD